MPRSKPLVFWLWIAVSLQVMTVAAESADEVAIRDRLKQAVEWLAAPEREGRPSGSPSSSKASASRRSREAGRPLRRPRSPHRSQRRVRFSDLA
jgi:hypothetical protein